MSSQKEAILNLDPEIKDYLIYLYEEYTKTIINQDELIYTATEILATNDANDASVINISGDSLIKTIEELYTENQLKIEEKKNITKTEITNLEPTFSEPPKIEEKEKKKEKSEGKIRYINNKIVTTKGERYIIEKEDLSDDMKKTYVNIKPFRKFRFH